MRQTEERRGNNREGGKERGREEKWRDRLDRVKEAEAKKIQTNDKMENFEQTCYSKYSYLLSAEGWTVAGFPCYNQNKQAFT